MPERFDVVELTADLIENGWPAQENRGTEN